MKKTAFAIMIITIFSKMLGFGREWVLSYIYGASATTDAYLVSRTIPSVVFAFIGAGIATGFIPMYSRILAEQGDLEANKFANNLNNALLLLASVFVAIVLMFTKPIVKLFASGFIDETLVLATNFTRISVFGVFFATLLGTFGGLLRLHGEFILPALVGVPMNAVIILSVLFSSKTNIYVLAVGNVLAIAAQLSLLLLGIIRETKYTHRPILNFKDPHLKQMTLLALPVIVGISINEINVLIDRTLASTIVAGGISALNYAGRLNGFVQGLFVSSVSVVLYPAISKMASEGKGDALKYAVSEAIGMINLLVIPTTMGAIVFSKEVVTFLFGRGAFTQDAIAMTANALLFYSLGMVAFGARDVLSRVFYAVQDTKTPMINATIGVVINIVLNVILSKYMGIGGLALATSISAIVTAILMFITLRKKIGPFGLREISISFIKISSASLIMSAFACGSFKLLLCKFGQNIALIGAIVIGVLTYAIIIYFMKIPEVDSTLATLRKKLAGRINGNRDRE